jgi:hypothetical protein
LTGCLICRAGNTSFSPIEALYGQEGMKTAILVDQRFVVLSTLGIIVATMYKGEPNSIHFKKIIFPPFVVVACLMNVFNFDFKNGFSLFFRKW